MATILDTIAAYAMERVRQDMDRIPLEEMRSAALALGKGGGAAFEAALRKEGMSFICEIKKASPSKGVIDPVFDYRSIGRAYENAGADAVSCLTEPKWFLGSDDIFREIRQTIQTPMLRKDFTVDDYQIYQARVMGANAVLLICALHGTERIARWLELCDTLGLAALVETHDEKEIASAVSAGARIIGVNNRNLKDFTVDFSNAQRLREKIPAGSIYVAESGVKGPEDVALLHRIGADAALIGEAFMRAEDKQAMLQRLRKAAQ